jgi:membrane-associated phospholipid phosphatase
MSQRSRRVAGAAAFVAFALLAVAVALGLTQPLDTRLREVFRPEDVWGPLQLRVDVVVEGLKPIRTLTGFAVLVLALAAVRRSWSPLRYALVLLAAAGLPAAVVKVALGRTDPHHELSSVGSFPSGHTLVLLVCLGGALLLLRRAPSWWEWLGVAVLDAVMAFALLVQVAHWFTDVLGGALLGVAVLLVVRPRTALGPTPPPGAGAASPGLPRSAAAPPSP